MKKELEGLPFKRIIFVTDLEVESLGEKKGGRAFYNTLTVYINKGWDVHLITSRGGVPEEFRNTIRVYERVFPTGIYEKPTKVGRLLGRYRYCRKINRFFLDTLNKIDDGKPCVVYAYEVAGVLVAKRWTARRGYPIISRFQGTWHANTAYTILNRFRFYPHLQALHAGTDMVIMTNDGTQGDKALKVCRNNSPAIRFWLNGVNVPSNQELDGRNDYRKQLHYDDKIICVTVSRLENWKRVDWAINAFALIAGECPQAELHIYGDGQSRQELEEQSRMLHIEKQVRFHGAVDHETIRKVMVASDVFLSLYDLSNVGNPLLEAMCAAKAIVTIDNGDTGKFIHNEETGILLPAPDIELIASSMLRLIKNKELRVELGQNARQFAQEHFWSWKVRMETEEKMVGELLDTAVKNKKII
ncbi:MAG: glycosyltransferase family 4 protein [Bacteroidales bacterium]|nr:glycosyltransferase family 4 protein [Bacteroidales bacterium]